MIRNEAPETAVNNRTNINELIILFNGEKSTEVFNVGADGEGLNADGVLDSDMSSREDLTTLTLTGSVRAYVPSTGITESDYRAVANTIGDEDSLLETSEEVRLYAAALVPADTSTVLPIVKVNSELGIASYYIDTTAVPFNDTPFYGIPRIYVVSVSAQTAGTSPDNEVYFNDIIAVRF